MDKWIGYTAAALFGALISYFILTQYSASSESWQLAYAHDEKGKTIEGSKAALIEAVLNGKPVRVYWAGRQVQHVTDSYFLTVLQGEVFAQIAPITGQRPSTNPAAVTLNDGEWKSIFATNGDRALKWFVQQ